MISGNDLASAIQETELILISWFANPIPQMGFWVSRRAGVNEKRRVFIGDSAMVAVVNIDHGGVAGNRDNPDGVAFPDVVYDLGT